MKRPRTLSLFPLMQASEISSARTSGRWHVRVLFFWGAVCHHELGSLLARQGVEPQALQAPSSRCVSTYTFLRKPPLCEARPTERSPLNVSEVASTQARWSRCVQGRGSSVASDSPASVDPAREMEELEFGSPDHGTRIPTPFLISVVSYLYHVS
jgi:hypothetical protein